MTADKPSSSDARSAATKSPDWVPSRRTPEDDSEEIESFPRALGIIAVVIVAIMLMSAMLNQYTAVDLTTIARIWAFDPASSSGLASTARASAAAAPNIPR